MYGISDLHVTRRPVDCLIITGLQRSESHQPILFHSYDELHGQF